MLGIPIVTISSGNLGGVTIEIYDCPGHTRGSIVMLIKEERALLLGDACNGFTFLFEDYSLPIETYEENLKKLKTQVEGKYDMVLDSHAQKRPEASGTNPIPWPLPTLNLRADLMAYLFQSVKYVQIRKIIPSKSGYL